MSVETLWEPSQARRDHCQLNKFKTFIENKYSKEFPKYLDLHKWSCEENESFWTDLVEFYSPILEGDFSHRKQSFIDYPWFQNTKINFAENLLRFKESDRIAINGQHESGTLRKISYKELYKEVSQFASFFKSKDIKEGDVVACYMPNIAETVIAMLACTSLGAIFTSTSSDFGTQGVIDRFGQTKPKILVTVTGYAYGGKFFDQTAKVAEVCEKIPSIENVVLVNFLNKDLSELTSLSLIKNISFYDEILGNFNQSEIEFTKVSFNSPLYIMYSSGTTGVPKCIVHSVGGTLIQHIKELGLHCDLTAEKNIMYFTTCGWMMWNWLVSSLFFGSTVTLYEGSPGYPSLKTFTQIIDREKINIFGTSPKFLKALEDMVGEDLGSDFDSLESMLSTGAPLLPEQFDYVYQAFKKDLLLSSICGGTDIVGCFMLGNPMLPVRRGEIQGPGLGMDIAAFDDKGCEVFMREGELVCRKPFISQPIGFWNDENHEKFKKAYFSVYENIWHHGDFITLTENKGVIVHGRSDATLNPGGVRIGTAEIYRQTEKISYIEDAVCVGQQFKGDVRVVLFVKLFEGELDPKKIVEIKSMIKNNTTPRHVPAIIRAVNGIPYTRSGKKMELAVSRLVNGKELTNIEAVANVDSLENFKNIEL